MDFTILSQANIVELITEVKCRFNRGELHMVGKEELNSLMNCLEEELMNRYAASYCLNEKEDLRDVEMFRYITNM